jgi:hypothetical protein
MGKMWEKYENLGFSPLEALLPTRFSIRNTKKDATFQRLVGQQFFFHQWIQLSKLDITGASQLNLKMTPP